MESFNNIVSTTPLVLVDFFATWCGPCKMMHLVLDDLKKKMGEDIRILKVDVDANPSVSEHYHVQTVPTLILFRNGATVWRNSGALALSELVKIVQQYK